MANHSPITIALAGSAAVAVLMFIAPVVPPIIALTTFVGLVMLSVTVILGYRWITSELKEGWEEAAPDDSDDEQEPIAELRQRYAEGKLTEQEFEAELERLLDEDDDPNGARHTDRSALETLDEPGSNES